MAERILADSISFLDPKLFADEFARFEKEHPCSECRNALCPEYRHHPLLAPAVEEYRVLCRKNGRTDSSALKAHGAFVALAVVQRIAQQLGSGSGWTRAGEQLRALSWGAVKREALCAGITALVVERRIRAIGSEVPVPVLQLISKKLRNTGRYDRLMWLGAGATILALLSLGGTKIKTSRVPLG